MSTHVHLIRTHYPHWGKFSGINQFVKYLNKEVFEFDIQVVSMDDENFPLPGKSVRDYFRRLVRLRGLQTYDLNDLIAELAALYKWLVGYIDILHYLDGEHSLQYLPFIFRRLNKLKPRPTIIATFHQPPEALSTLVNIDTIRLLDHVIVLCPEQVSFFEELLPPSRVSMILHGVDVDYFQPHAESKEKNKFSCISVGSWLRDYDCVLALAEMLKSYPNIEFNIVSSVVTPPSDLGNVSIHSGLGDDELLRIYQQSDVLLQPMRGATANNAILEGIACGLPVVTSNLDSIKAYVSSTEAILIPENKPESFAEALLYLYKNPDMRKEMAANARRRASELSWQNIAIEYEKMYLELLS